MGIGRAGESAEVSGPVGGLAVDRFQSVAEAAVIQRKASICRAKNKLACKVKDFLHNKKCWDQGHELASTQMCEL